MNIPLDEAIYFDVITSNPSTGAVSDADSTPTFEVFEESTDTDIGVGGNLTKRTSKTGDYRGTFTISAANGFEVGKWYNVIVSATVNSVAGKAVAKRFRVVAAETVAGVSKVDVTHQLGVAILPYDFTISAVTSSTITLPSTDAAGNTISDNDQFAHGILYCVGGTGAGNIVQLGEAHATDVRKYNLGYGQTQLFDNTSQVVVLNVNGNSNVTNWRNATVAAPNTSGVPAVDAVRIGGTSQTGADVGANTATAAIAGAVWNALTASYGSANTYGAMLEADHATSLANNSVLAYLESLTHGLVLAQGTIGSTGNDTTHVHLANLTYGNDEINDYLLVMFDVSTNEYHATWIEDWVLSTELATVTTLPFTPQDATDTYWLLPNKRDIFTTAVKNAIADAILLRNASNTEGSAGEHTLTTVILAMLETAISGTTLTIKRTDGSTTHATKTLTTNAAAEPITGVS